MTTDTYTAPSTEWIYSDGSDSSSGGGSIYVPKYSVRSHTDATVTYDYSGVGVIHPDDIKGLNLFAFVFNNKKKPVTDFITILKDDYDLLPLGIFTPFSKFVDIQFRKASELPFGERKKWTKPLSKLLATASARAL